jgi:hypothetical protein
MTDLGEHQRMVRGGVQEEARQQSGDRGVLRSGAQLGDMPDRSRQLFGAARRRPPLTLVDLDEGDTNRGYRRGGACLEWIGRIAGLAEQVGNGDRQRTGGGGAPSS